MRSQRPSSNGEKIEKTVASNWTASTWRLLLYGSREEIKATKIAVLCTIGLFGLGFLFYWISYPVKQRMSVQPIVTSPTDDDQRIVDLLKQNDRSISQPYLFIFELKFPTRQIAMQATSISSKQAIEKAGFTPVSEPAPNAPGFWYMRRVSCTVIPSQVQIHLAQKKLRTLATNLQGNYEGDWQAQKL